MLDDVDSGTFVRFCQFAYSGDYEPPALVQDAGRANLDDIDRAEEKKMDEEWREVPDDEIEVYTAVINWTV